MKKILISSLIVFFLFVSVPHANALTRIVNLVNVKKAQCAEAYESTESAFLTIIYPWGWKTYRGSPYPDFETYCRANGYYFIGSIKGSIGGPSIISFFFLIMFLIPFFFAFKLIFKKRKKPAPAAPAKK